MMQYGGREIDSELRAKRLNNLHKPSYGGKCIPPVPMLSSWGLSKR